MTGQCQCRIAELMADPRFLNAPFVKQQLVAGSHDIGIIDVRNNPAGDYTEPPLSDNQPH